MGRWGCLIGVSLLIIAAIFASSVETLGDLNLNIAIVCLLIGIIFLIIGSVSFSLRKFAEKSEEVRKCKKCGTKIDETDKTCPKCGTEFE